MVNPITAITDRPPPNASGSGSNAQGILVPRPWARFRHVGERGNTLGRREARRVLPLLLGVTAAAGLSLYWLAQRQDVPVDHQLGLVFVLATLAALAEIVGFSRDRATAGSVGLVPITAALLIAPSWITVVLAVLGQSVVFTVQGRQGFKILYNAVQVALSVSLGTLTLLAISNAASRELVGSTFGDAALRLAPITLALVVVTLAANAALMSVAISLSSETKFLAVLKRALKSSGPLTFLLAIFSFYLAWLSVNLGVFGTAGMVLPLLAVRQLYRTTTELTRVTEELLDLMVAAIEARDPYTSGHSKRVANTSAILARALGLSSAQVERVTVAALLHDVGKIDEAFAPILAKEGRLTPEEWALMKKHPVRSAELVGMLTSLRDVVGPVRHHHENWDGTGYPDGLKGEEIPLTSRIIMFADTLDAITTDRPYRRALSMEDARSEFLKFRSKQFDPEMCDVVLRADVWELLYQSIEQHETKIAERKAS